MRTLASVLERIAGSLEAIAANLPKPGPTYDRTFAAADATFTAKLDERLDELFQGSAVLANHFPQRRSNGDGSGRTGHVTS